MTASTSGWEWLWCWLAHLCEESRDEWPVRDLRVRHGEAVLGDLDVAGLSEQEDVDIGAARSPVVGVAPARGGLGGSAVLQPSLR